MHSLRAFISSVPHRIKISFTSGLSPYRLALTITLAVLLGVFPFFFIPSVLIALAIFTLRLNPGVMLVFNYMAWPLQIILFIPYIRLGNWLFGSSTGDISFENFTHAFKSNFWGALRNLFSVILNATGAWAVSSIPAGIVLFYILYYTARAVAAKRLRHNNAPQLAQKDGKTKLPKVF